MVEEISDSEYELLIDQLIDMGRSERWSVLCQLLLCCSRTEVKKAINDAKKGAR
jgi:hypothetical protein